MIKALDRVLSPGGRYVTFSLHALDEVEPYFTSPQYNWRVRSFRIRSSRFQETEEGRKRAVAHSMIVCDKPNKDGGFDRDCPEKFALSMTEDELNALMRHASEV